MTDSPRAIPGAVAGAGQHVGDRHRGPGRAAILAAGAEGGGGASRGRVCHLAAPCCILYGEALAKYDGERLDDSARRDGQAMPLLEHILEIRAAELGDPHPLTEPTLKIIAQVRRRGASICRRLL